MAWNLFPLVGRVHAGDGAGVTGGQGGEGRALQCFMVRIRIPNGLLSSEQLRAIAELTRRYAHGIADITVRQKSLHWITIEALPDLLEALGRVGLNTTVPAAMLRAMSRLPVQVWMRRDLRCFAFGPRSVANAGGQWRLLQPAAKFKISITGCRVWCPYPEINDVA